MSFIDKVKNSKYMTELAERAVKTFGQFYLAYWLFLNPDGGGISPEMFDTLFTTQNLKAGVVGLALSVATSLGSKPFGDKNSASLVD